MSAVVRIGSTWFVRDHVAAVTPGQYPSSNPQVLLTGGHTVTVDVDDMTADDVASALYADGVETRTTKAAFAAQLEHAAAERARRRAREVREQATRDALAARQPAPTVSAEQRGAVVMILHTAGVSPSAAVTDQVLTALGIEVPRG